MTRPRPFRSGINWMPDRGKLYRFDKEGVTVIRPWPDPSAWRKSGDGPWRGFVPDVDIAAADGESNTWPGIFEAEAWSTVPAEVRGLVRRAACPGRQWKALNLAARVPGAHDLMLEVPLLAAALADVNWLRSVQGRSRLTHPWRAARRHCARGTGWKVWLPLAEWLGLPRERGFLRVMRRAGDGGLEPWAPNDLASAVAAWHHPRCRTLMQHLPMVSGQLAYLLERSIPDRAFLRQLRPTLFADAHDRHTVSYITDTALTLLMIREQTDRRRPLPPLTSLERLEEVREAHLDDLPRRPAPVSGPFPPPPLPGTDHITPLASPEALVAEGAAMGHCIGGIGWARLARRRMGYGYAVRIPGPEGAPRRGTVWIAPSASRPDRFHVEQLQGPGNTTPHKDVRTTVDRWLSRHMADLQRNRSAHTAGAGVVVPEVWRERPCWPFPDDGIPF